MPKKSCKVDPNYFCYICGKYIVAKKGKIMTGSLKFAYLHYFGFAVGDTEKPWIPKLFCNTCRTKLYRWSMGENVHLPFSSPMLWREPKNHNNDCYFCLTKVFGISGRTVRNIKYADVSSVTKPVQRSDEDPLPICPGASSSNMETSDPVTSSGSEFVIDERHLITQAELNDLVRDLHLSKGNSEVLASRLQQWKLLSSETKVTVYRKRNEDLMPFFNKINQICFCNDIIGLFRMMDQPYDKNEWRLFIDGSKYSLKAALLHNGNEKPSIPIVHAVNTKESYVTMNEILKRIKYDEHKWKICGDLKVFLDLEIKLRN